MSRKTIVLILLLVATVFAGAFVVAAQDDDEEEVVPYGGMHHGGMFGPGMGGMHGGFGMMDDEFEPMMFAVADALGLEQAELIAALQDGQTLGEIAEAQGVSLDMVYDAMLTRAESHMAEMVEAGVITQEQADEHLAWMQEHMTEMPMFSGGFGPCMGGHSERGMGRGHHRGDWHNS